MGVDRPRHLTYTPSSGDVIADRQAGSSGGLFERPIQPTRGDPGAVAATAARARLEYAGATHGCAGRLHRLARTALHRTTVAATAGM